MRSIAAALIALLLAAPLAAGVYSPHEPTPFTIRPDGTAEALAFGTEGAGPFQILFLTRMNELDANPLRANNPDRQKVLARIAAASTTTRDPRVIGVLAADLLRVGKADEALNRLAPLRRDPDAGFVVQMNLAHVHAVRGEWREAMPVHEDAAFRGLPDDLAGTSPAQRKWLEKVEKTYYTRWLRIHAERSLARPSPMTEDVLPLFEGVVFANEGGRYEPGKISAASRAKLPPDAVAVTQQLLLWAPWDTSLYWLLGELYAAEGKVREAARIFDQCADGRQYSNRTIFYTHRAAVRDAVEKMGPPSSGDISIPDLGPAAGSPKDDAKNDELVLPPMSRIVPVAIVFGLLVLVLLMLQARSLSRRFRRG